MVVYILVVYWYHSVWLFFIVSIVLGLHGLIKMDAYVWLEAYVGGLDTFSI